MAAALEIRDGTPYWWESPDIWVVPGADPYGPPGPPIAGQAAFLWGRVRNNGDAPVQGATTNFYWSNPATGVLRSNSTLVGSAFVDLNPAEIKEVLCVIPWIPVIVNDGHECLVAEVIHSADPLPAPLPDPFDPPTYRQVAQKNLSVLATAKVMRALPIQLAAPIRQRLSMRLSLEAGGTLDKESLRLLGLEGYRQAKVQPKAGLSLTGGCDNHEDVAKELKVTLEPGTARAAYLRLEAVELPERSYVPVRVVMRIGDRVGGGVSYVLVEKES